MDELLSLFGGAVDDVDHSSSASPDDHDDHHCRTSSTTTAAAATANADFRSALLGVSSVGDTLNSRDELANRNRKPSAKTTTTTSSAAAAAAAAASASGTLRRTNNSTATKKSTTNPNVTNNNSTPCDPITGLRIVDRRTSRADMVDAFSSFTYRTCSILAASSRVDWSREYLVDGGGGKPSQAHTNIGSNNVGGKTNVATCGILTCDSSSRLSSKTGRAFATLTLGDLPSSTCSSFSNSSSSSSNEIHASVTVFLFGDALSVLRAGTKQYLRPGWAVAILGPNLMPPRSDSTMKNNGSGGATTSVTLSVNDPRQILPIGRAMDCDRCKGTIRKRIASDGALPRWEDVRCCTLVDTRHIGGRGYCQMHRKQGLSSAGSGGGTNKANKNDSNLTFMQRQRNEHSMQNSTAYAGNLRLGVGGNASTLTSLSALLHDHPSTTMPDQNKCMLKRAPLNMKKLPNVNVAVGAATNTKDVQPENPYLRAKTGTMNKGSTTSTTDPKRKQPLHDILGEALDGKRSRSTISSDRRPQLKVFNTNGYDGSVQVPKPNAILFQHSGASNSCSMHSTHSLPIDHQSSASILDKQRSLAELLKKNGNATGSSKANSRNLLIDKQSITHSKQKILSTKRGLKVAPTTALGNINSRQNRRENDFASAFSGSITSTGEQHSYDLETVLNAKSRFASAADAEEYARARSVVQALEAKEGAKEGANSRKKDAKPPLVGSIVTTGWACRSCNKTTPFKPVSCIHARHDVRQCREIKGGSGTLGLQKNRLGMHGKDEQHGGLTLGSGLEWSGWRGGFG